MFKILLIMISAIMISMPVMAKTQYENIVGYVSHVETLTNTYIKKIPRDERVCSVQDIPVYGPSQQGNNLGSIIVGGLIGSAVGNKVSNNHGAGAAGAVIGALLGNNHANQSSRGGNITSYRQQETCQTNRTYDREQITNIIGYRIQVDADGRIITLDSKRSFDVGNQISIRKQFSYSIGR